MEFTRETFPYQEYSNFISDGEFSGELNDDQRKFLYDDAVRETLKQQKKLFTGAGSEFRSVDETLKLFPDSHNILGVPVKSNDEAEALRFETFREWAKDNVNDQFKDRPVTEQLGRYISSQVKSRDGKFKYPSFRTEDSSTLKRVLQEDIQARGFNLGDEFKPISINDILNDTNRQEVNASTTPPPLEDGAFNTFTTGFGAGLSDLAGKTIEGIATLGNQISTKLGDVRFLERDEQNNLNLFKVYSPEQVAQGLQEAETLSPGFLGQLGRNIQDFSKDISEDSDQDSFAFKAGQVAGQLSGFIGSGLAGAAGRGLSASRAGATAILSGSEFQLDDYENVLLSENETEFNADEAQTVALFGNAIGSLETLPVVQTFKRLTGIKTTPGLVKWLDDTSGGVLKRAIKQGAKGAIEEGLQETISQIAQNLVAKDIVGYDPQRDLYSGTVESGATGAAAGGFLNSLLGLISGRRSVSSNINQDPEDGQDSENSLDPNTQQSFDDSQPVVQQPEQPIDSVDEESQTPSQPQTKVVQTDSGRFIATRGNQLGFGDSNDQALINLDATGGDTIPSISEGEFIIDSQSSNGTTTYTFESGDSRITLVEPEILEQGENTLDRLVNLNNSDNGFTLPNNLNLRQLENNLFQASVGNVSSIKSSYEEAITDLNDQLTRPTVPSNNIGIDVQQIDPATQLPLTSKGNFNTVESERVLNENGFNVLPAGKVNNITDGNLIAYKDGLIYKLKRRKSKDTSVGYDTQIVSVDGNKVTSPLGENNRQAVVDSSGKLVSDNISLFQPATGVKIIRQNIAGQPQVLIDPSSIVQVAETTEGTVGINEGDVASINYGDDTVTFYVKDNKVFVERNNETLEFENDFSVLNRTPEKGVTLSVVTDNLIRKGYDVKKAKQGEIELENNEGDVISLKSEDGKIVSTKKPFEGKTKTISLETQSDIREINAVERSDQLSLQISQDKELLSDSDGLISNETPVVVDVNQVQQEVIGEFALVGQEDFELVDNKPTSVSDIGPNVILDIDTDNIESEQVSRTIFNLASDTYSSAASDSYDANESDTVDWNRDNLQQYISMLPPHIQDIISVHYQKNNPARNLNAAGYFDPAGSIGPGLGRGANIHIDAASDRTLHRVLSTLSEEVAHFSFDSWSVDSLSKLYDMAYDVIKDPATQGLQSYINDNGVNVDNPLPHHKHLLVNEYFSKQGTSILNFVDDKIDLPPGITQAELQKIKREVKDQIVQVEFDLTKDFDATDKTQAKQFIRDILRLQSGGVLGKGIVLTYRIDQPGRTKANLIVRNTPSGQSRYLLPENKPSFRLRRIKNILENTTGRTKQLYRFYRNNIASFYNTTLGRETTLLISGSHTGLSKLYADTLRDIKQNALRIRSLLDSKGYQEVSIDTSYVSTFKKLGLDNKPHIKLAKEFDEFLQQAHHEGYRNVGLIQEEFRQSIIKLREFGLVNDVPSDVIIQFISELRSQASRYTTDWAHRRYRSYQPDGLKDLQLMQSELSATRGASFLDPTKIVSTESLAEKAIAAQKEIDTINARRQQGEISQIEADRQINNASKPISLHNRINALRRWAIAELGAGSIGVDGELTPKSDSVLRLMRNELGRVIRQNENNQTNSPSAAAKLELIDTVRGRTLDETDPHDQDYMTFLEQITDPLEVAIHNLEQQNKVIHTLRFNNRLAEQLIKTGVANIKQSRLTNESTDDSIGTFQSGSLLKYIDVDSEFQPFLQDEILLNQSFNNAQVNWLLGSAKANLTVFNEKVLLSNYISNVGVLLHNGHIAYLHKYFIGGEATQATKEAFTGRMNFTLSESGSIGKSIAQEMEDAGLLSSGFTNLTVETSRSDLITKATEILTGVVNEAAPSIVNSDLKARTDFFVDNAINKIKKIYGFGDDWAKILPYMLNRELGVAKAQFEILRSEFEPGVQGDAEYRKAITESAVDYAVTRTQRDTVTWADSPNWIRNAVKDNRRFFYGDYLMHPAQMLKIMLNSAAIIFEDGRELSRLRSAGSTNNDYYRTLRNRELTRIAGNAVTYGNASKLAVGASSIFTAGLYSLGRFFFEYEDDNNEPIQGKSYYTPDQLEGAVEILNTQSFDGSSLQYPIPVYREGFTIFSHDGRRSNAMNTFGFVNPANDLPLNENLENYLLQVTRNFSPIDPREDGEGFTILGRLISIFQGNRDQFGNEIGDLEARFRAASDLLAPGMVNSAFSIITGRTISGRKVDREVKLSRLAGIKVKAYDTRDTVTALGYVAADILRNNQSKDELLNRLSSGDELSRAEITNLIETNISFNQRAMSEIRYGIEAHRKFGFNDDLIFKHLQIKADGVSKSNIGKENARNLVAGVNIFTEKMPTSIGNRLVKISSKSATRKFTQENIDNATTALSIAAEQYGLIMAKELSNRDIVTPNRANQITP